MPLLILAITSFLLFLAVQALLLIADRLEARGTQPQESSALRKPARKPPLLSIHEAFDPACSMLWEAPSSALQLVEAAGRSGVQPMFLRSFYCRAAASFPEIYEGSDFASWLRLLEESALIKWEGGRLLITADGQAFLKFHVVAHAPVRA